MADVSLVEALALAQQRILTLAVYAIPTASGAYPYTDPKGTFAKYFELLPPTYRLERIGQGSGKQRYTVSTDLRFKVGLFTQSLRGQVQQAIWDYLFSAGQVFEVYRGLNDPNDLTSQRVPYLNMDLTIVATGKPQLLTEETGQVWYLVFPWTLTFDTMFDRCGL